MDYWITIELLQNWRMDQELVIEIVHINVNQIKRMVKQELYFIKIKDEVMIIN